MPSSTNSDIPLPQDSCESPIPVILSDVNRMRGNLLGAELMRSRPRFRVGSCAASRAELLELAKLDADIAIVSAGLRDGPLSGFEALRQLHAHHPKSRKIMVLDACEQDLVLAAFRGGARGVFSRASSVDDFVKCVERVHEGQIWAGNTELEFVLSALSSLCPLRVPPIERALSRREEQIALLLAEGANHQAIAHKLNLTERGVAEALTRIFTKLGIQSRVELVLACGQRIPGRVTCQPASASAPLKVVAPDSRAA